MTTIKTYTGQTANFYIQTKGLHAGRPMKNAIANCVAVDTDVENAFEIVYALWTAKKFQSSIIGSVVAFIRVSDLKKIVSAGFDAVQNTDKVKQIQLLDVNIQALEKKVELLKQMKIAMARNVFKK